MQLSSPNNTMTLPSSISARLTFNGVAGTTMTFMTTGDAPGDVLTLALQSPTTMTQQRGVQLQRDGAAVRAVGADDHGQHLRGVETPAASAPAGRLAGWIS